MGRVATIIIPYKPRRPEIHSQLETHRYSVLVAHRRFGKTVLAVNHLIKMALLEDRQDGFFAYAAPFREQAKSIAWNYLKRYTENIPQRTVNESELWVSVPSRGGRAKIRLFGADNPDALRGLYYDGVVLDEVAQMKANVWQEVIRPALVDRGGWALFIGTPKGVNLFSDLYYRAVNRFETGDPLWYGASFPATETGLIPQKELEAIKDELSENAFRQEFLCDFAASSDDVLIPLTIVDEAMRRTRAEHEYRHAPLILGVDVARFGDDSSVLCFRQGLVAEKPIMCKGLDNMELADRIAFEIRERKPNAVFVDAGGGAGVIDRLRHLGHWVQEVPFGSQASYHDKYVNKRAEMWDEMRKWIEGGGCLPANEALRSELTTPTYSFDAHGKIKLEPKDKIKERLTHSPDIADALCLTFAAPVAAPDVAFRQERINANNKYDPLGW